MAESGRYPVQIAYSDEDKGFIATAPDLPGCSAFGDTEERALEELRDAIEAWLAAARAAGNLIPEPFQPLADPLPSGRILLRLPRTLHAALIETAKRENVSLNQQIVSLLSAGVAVAQFSQMATRAAQRISFPLGLLGYPVTHTVDISATTRLTTLRIAVPHQQETVRTDEVLDIGRLV